MMHELRQIRPLHTYKTRVVAMSHSPSPFIGLALTLVTSIGFGCNELSGQVLPGIRQGPVRDAFNAQGAAIGGQQVQRQAEVSRLDRILDGFESRMTRLERQLLGATRMPMITIAEAEASVAFAQAQLRASERLQEQGEATELRLAADRLAVARAQGQFHSAKTAHADSLIVLELEVLHAERRLLRENQEQKSLERFVAKGYTSSDGLRLHLLDVSLAEKQLQLARLRLESQKKSAASSEPESEHD
jgi:hypothetical protein